MIKRGWEKRKAEIGDWKFEIGNLFSPNLPACRQAGNLKSQVSSFSLKKIKIKNK
jgi:hypothetical protein